MIFEISRHKLKGVIYKYLNTYYGNLIEKEGRYHYGKIYIKNGYDNGCFVFLDDKLYISGNIFDEVTNVFPLDEEDLANVISTWFTDKYGKKFSRVYVSTNPDYEIWRTEDDDDNTRWF